MVTTEGEKPMEEQKRELQEKVKNLQKRKKELEDNFDRSNDKWGNLHERELIDGKIAMYQRLIRDMEEETNV